MHQLRSLLRDGRYTGFSPSLRVQSQLAQVLFPLFRQVVFAPIASPRAAAMDELIQAAATVGTPAVAAPSVEAALEIAVEFANDKPIVISGSVYLVGAARGILCRQQFSQGGEA